MRVTLVALYLPDGAMLHYTSQLANALSSLVEVSLFTPANPRLADYLSPAVRVVESLPITFRGAPTRSYLTQLLPWVHATNARRLRALESDLFHFPTPHPAHALFGPWLRGLRTCYTCHDPSGHPGESSPWRDWMIHRATRWADRVIVHGEALREELLAQRVPPWRVEVIPHGDFGFLTQHAPDLAEEELILCFGRFSPYKGMEVLCRAEQLFSERLGSYRLCFAGEGPADFREAIGPSGRVEVINRFLADEEVATLFQRARLVVLPYTQASQSGVLAIAQAFGKPVIVTSVGALPEAVRHGQAGLIVPPGDPVALAAAIERLWSQPELRAQLGTAARHLAAHDHSWAQVAQRTVACYQHLLALAPGGRLIPGSATH